MKFPRKGKTEKIHKMDLRQSLETVAILAKHLRTYAPFIAAIGNSTDKTVRQELVVRIASQLIDDKDAFTELSTVISNLTGSDVGDVSLLFDKLPEAWNANDMKRLFSACYSLGILDKADLANLAWAEANWRKHGNE